MLKALLQGKPIGHPLHPILVHFPIGLFLLTSLLDIAAYAWDQPALPRAAFVILFAGVVTALLAALPGFVDYFDIRRDHPARKTANWHMTLNLLAVFIYSVSLLLRWNLPPDQTTPLLPVALSFVALAIISLSGYLGGILVYDNGIAVGRHRRIGKTPDQTLVIKSSGEWVDITDAASMQDGQTLRAQANGAVIAIARVNGQYHAFQEFCTHRCGPLSEGCFRDGKIVCPWHGSEFELTTGKIAQGPAKVDLKRFDTEVRDGRLLVRVTEGK